MPRGASPTKGELSDYCRGHPPRGVPSMMQTQTRYLNGELVLDSSL